MHESHVVAAGGIENRILLIRGERVFIDADLAGFYGVPTRRLNEQVRRNTARFPMDFAFRLSMSEKLEVVANCDHLRNIKYSKTLPWAFTEHRESPRGARSATGGHGSCHKGPHGIRDDS